MAINLEKSAPEIPETHWTKSWELGHVYVAAAAAAVVVQTNTRAKLSMCCVWFRTQHWTSQPSFI